MKNLASSIHKGWRSLKASFAKKHRRAGNAARDRKDWDEAARCYREYLRFVPEDAPIWVQLGHSLKEDGRLEEAEQAYRTAATLAPRDADLRINHGELLIRLGFKDRAAKVLLEAMRIDPTWGTVEQLTLVNQRGQALGLVDQAAENHRANIRCLELRDLFQYLGSHPGLTGITRVVVGVIKYLLEDLDKAEAKTYQFVHIFGDGEAAALLSKEKLRHLVQLATAESVADLPAMQALIADIRNTAKLMHLKAGDLYFIPGAFWEFAGSPAWLLSNKRKGVYIGGFIHDLIPLTHPHFFTSPLSDMFNVAFADASRFYDFAVVTSEFVAKQVGHLIEAWGIAPLPISPLPLAHELHFETSKRAADKPSATARVDALSSRPFVLCVCTIEARKNHIYLFYIWQLLIGAGIDVPDLVFVGRAGWHVDDLLGQIEASRYLEDRLRIVHGLSDTELAVLYDRCMFTVFPSFVEGWGLPVGESLAYGKVCVASSAASIPEVGGEFALYIDPFNLHSGYDAILKLIQEPTLLKEMENRIGTGFVARTWQDVGRDFFRILDREFASACKEGSRNGNFAPELQPGFLLDMKWLEEAGERRRAYAKNPARLIMVEGWRGIAGTGTWMLEAAAKVRFRSEYEVGRQVSIRVLVGTSPWVAKDNILRIWASGNFLQRTEPESDFHHARQMQKDANFWVRLKGRVEDDNIVTVQFQIEGPTVTPMDAGAPLALRLHAIGYDATDEYEARTDFPGDMDIQLIDRE